MSSESIAKMTAEARRSVSAARMAAGEPWQDDSDRDIHWLAREAEAIRDRMIARRNYSQWKRSHPITWRFRTYTGDPNART